MSQACGARMEGAESGDLAVRDVSTVNNSFLLCLNRFLNLRKFLFGSALQMSLVDRAIQEA
jgi:hypothetical protein